MKKTIVCTLALLIAVLVYGETASDTVKVYFKIGESQYDGALDGNAKSMDEFIDKVRATYQSDNLGEVVVRSNTSPDGSDPFNAQLSVERCNSIVKLIMDRADIPRDVIKAEPQGVDWGELRRLVAETPEVPSRAKILDIIDHTPITVFDGNGRIVDGRKKQLMDLRGGRPYRWMFEHLFPQLRNSVAVSLYTKQSQPVSAGAEQVSRTSSDNETLMNVTAVSVQEAEVSGDFSASELSSAQTSDSETDNTEVNVEELTKLLEGGSEASPYTFDPRFALKSNMLYDAILLPNFELEWLITDNWSVAVEGNVAWWGKYSHNKSYRLALIDGEGKYWINQREPWHGLNVGVIAGGGWYDLQNGSPGYHGWGVMSGLTVGYMWPITRTFSFEAQVGVGYMYTRYKEYQPIDNHHVYLRTKDLNYFGPVKLQFSIAWRFGEINKPKLRESAR